MVALRVDMRNLPLHVSKQLHGERRHRQSILDALEYFDGCAHANEIFHYMNTNEDGEWLTVKKPNKRNGNKLEATVPVPMAAIQTEVKTMIDVGEAKRIGQRSGYIALPEWEGELPGGAEDEDTSDEDASEDEDE